MAMGIRKVGDDSGSVYDTEWYKESVVKAERGNREHIAKYDRSFAGIMAKGDAKSRDLADDEIDRDDGGGGASDHHASKVADLLVEAGSHPDRSAALSYLLHSPHGAALLHRMSKKETTPMKDTIHSIMKSGGIAATCAAIVAKGLTSISEHELVEAASKVAAERYPEISESQAFAKVYADPTEGRVLRQAINVAKASLAETMLGPGLPVTVVGGPAAQDVNNATDAEQARAELMRIGRKQYPRLTENQVFEAALTDPRNAAITARLYQRPTPTSIYPMPREWLRGEGSQHAKADHGSAYNDLLAKAAEYRNSHPELSEAQAFSKVYSDPANVTLAKRERAESR
jgi:hypothetical protein